MLICCNINNYKFYFYDIEYELFEVCFVMKKIKTYIHVGKHT
jgi:hypothetical protein